MSTGPYALPARTTPPALAPCAAHSHRATLHPRPASRGASLARAQRVLGTRSAPPALTPRIRASPPSLLSQGHASRHSRGHSHALVHVPSLRASRSLLHHLAHSTPRVSRTNIAACDPPTGPGRAQQGSQARQPLRRTTCANAAGASASMHAVVTAGSPPPASSRVRSTRSHRVAHDKIALARDVLDMPCPRRPVGSASRNATREP